MAKIEQMVCRLARDVHAPAILGRSQGLTREVANEALQLAMGWQPLLGNERQRPLYLSKPLRNPLPGAPGRVFVAMRALTETIDSILCHILFLAESDFAGAGYSPYHLEREGLYLDHWTGSHVLDRKERAADATPLAISPPPGPQDAEVLDESLRLFFGTMRLVIPLARPEPTCDRFLALFLESLPHHVKRQLYFISFASQGQADFAVGGVYVADGGFRSWQHSLLTMVRHPLAPHLEQYVNEARRCLTAGDVAALARAAQSYEPPPEAAGGLMGARPPLAAAAVTQEAEPVAEMHTWQRSHVESDADAGGAAASAATAPASGVRRPVRRAAPARARRGAGGAGRRRSSGGAKLALGAGALVVGVVLVLVVLPRRPQAPAEMARQAVRAVEARVQADEAKRPPQGGQTPPAPAAAQLEAPAGAAQRTAEGGGLGGVVGIGDLYSSELEGIKDKDAARAGAQEGLAASRRALASLRERGGESLLRQCGEYLTSAGPGLREPTRPDREAKRAQELAPKGAALAREARRLALAGYALDHGSPWTDLGQLDERRLAARWDSLRETAPREAAAILAELGMTDVIERIDAARAETAARARLATLLAQPRRDRAWLTELERAAGAWDGREEPPAEIAWRDLALALTRLKRAEDQTGFGGLAYARDYDGGAWVPEVVREAAAALRDEVARDGETLAPPLVLATLAFHDGLARVRALSAARADADQLAGAVSSLAANPAVAFDPDGYGAHVDRARLCALTGLLAQGRTPDSAPAALFPGEDRRGTLALLSLTQADASAEAWSDLATGSASPFIKRWASLRADAAVSSRSRADTFDSDFQRLASLAADVSSRAQRGQDWSSVYADLSRELAAFRDQHRPAPGLPADRAEKLARVEALAAAAAKPLPVPLEAVSVRLDAGQLRAPAEVVVELTGEDGEPLAASEAILLQAGADGAWTGTRALGVELSLRPAQPVTALVRRVADARQLITVRYGAETATMVPGALRRPLAGDANSVPGTVAFTTADWFWRRLRLPDLRQPLANASMGGASPLP